MGVPGGPGDLLGLLVASWGRLGPSWGPLGPPWGPTWPPRKPPKKVRSAPFSTLVYLPRSTVPSGDAQHTSQRPSRRRKRLPGGPKEAPRGPQTAPKTPQEAYKRLQEAPKKLKRSPTGHQNGPQDAPRAFRPASWVGTVAGWAAGHWIFSLLVLSMFSLFLSTFFSLPYK